MGNNQTAPDRPARYFEEAYGGFTCCTDEATGGQAWSVRWDFLISCDQGLQSQLEYSNKLAKNIWNLPSFVSIIPHH